MAKSSTRKPRWLTPKQTLDIVAASRGTDIAGGLILERLRGYKIIAYAHSGWSKSYDGQTTDNHDGMTPIPGDMWNDLANERFWDSGDVLFSRFSYSLSTPTETFRFFDVRFDAAVIGKMFPAPAQREASITEPPREPTDAEEGPKQKGPPVSEAALTAWYAAYRLAYVGSEDTLAKAYASAEGMFPGKFVSRERIRRLAGGRKPGRKVETKQWPISRVLPPVKSKKTL